MFPALRSNILCRIGGKEKNILVVLKLNYLPKWYRTTSWQLLAKLSVLELRVAEKETWNKKIHSSKQSAKELYELNVLQNYANMLKWCQATIVRTINIYIYSITQSIEVIRVFSFKGTYSFFFVKKHYWIAILHVNSCIVLLLLFLQRNFRRNIRDKVEISLKDWIKELCKFW